MIKMIDSWYEEKPKVDIINYRDFIGGYWEEIGELELKFMIANGLQPSNTFIDVGCGALRGGKHFINYLNKNHYFGTDINEHLIKLGLKFEIIEQNKEKINANSFIVSDDFNFDFDNIIFDYGIAFALFIHLSENKIIDCLKKLKLKFNGGTFFATFLIKDGHIGVDDKGSGMYYYSIKQIQNIAKLSGWNVEILGKFGHPRKLQEMVKFY